MMNTIHLTCTIITNPDSLVGFQFYVEAGNVFDADDYAAAYKLNRADLDADDVHAVKDTAEKLNEGEWLEVSHSIAV
jgi:hypothetical protein